jgi:hypothetical protein
MALTGALCHTLLAATGFTNKNLRVLIAGLLGSDYRPNQMTYDLRRLRLNGLIRRIPRSNRYMLTDDGTRIAIFYTKIYNRTLILLTAANQPQAPPELRAALATITSHAQVRALGGSTWSGCTSTHRRVRWCSAWTRSRSARPWTEPSRACR